MDPRYNVLFVEKLDKEIRPEIETELKTAVMEKLILAGVDPVDFEKAKTELIMLAESDEDVSGVDFTGIDLEETDDWEELSLEFRLQQKIFELQYPWLFEEQEEDFLERTHGEGKESVSESDDGGKSHSNASSPSNSPASKGSQKDDEEPQDPASIVAEFVEGIVQSAVQKALRTPLPDYLVENPELLKECKEILASADDLVYKKMEYHPEMVEADKKYVYLKDMADKLLNGEEVEINGQKFSPRLERNPRKNYGHHRPCHCPNPFIFSPHPAAQCIKDEEELFKKTAEFEEKYPTKSIEEIRQMAAANQKGSPSKLKQAFLKVKQKAPFFPQATPQAAACQAFQNRYPTPKKPKARQEKHIDQKERFNTIFFIIRLKK